MLCIETRVYSGNMQARYCTPGDLYAILTDELGAKIWDGVYLLGD